MDNIKVKLTPSGNIKANVNVGVRVGALLSPGGGGTRHGIPEGGTTGQALVKASNDDYDAIWKSLDSGDVAYSDSETYGDGTVGKEVSDLKSAFDNVITLRQGYNLIDKSVVENGVLVNKAGTVSTAGSYANYLTSDYLPIKGNTPYTLYLADASGLDATHNTRLIYVLFDENKTGLSITNVAGVNSLSVNPTVDGYIRISCYNGNPTYFMTYLMLIKGTNYVPYEDFYSQVFLSNNINPINTILSNEFDNTNVLRGKKWVVCGDSFTAFTNAQFTDGKYTAQYKTYPRLIALRNNMNLVRFFASGRTLAYPSDGSFANSLTNPNAEYYYQNIPQDVDYITIYLGINDSHHETGQGGDGEDPTGLIPLGTITDDTTATYYGAWNVVLTWLITNRPFAHIGIIVSNGVDREAYRTAQLEIARKYGIPFIDLNGDDRTPCMIRSQNPDIASAVKTAITRKQAVDYDGTITGSVNLHPNWQAHEYESTFIEAFLRSI